MAPWATAEMVQKRADQLEIAIEAAKASGGCAKAVQCLETKLKQQTKKGGELVEVWGRIRNTKGFITRAEKRHMAEKKERERESRTRELASVVEQLQCSTDHRHKYCVHN